MNLRTAFIKAATWHGSLDEAESMLRTNPQLADSDIHTAAVTANIEALRKFITKDPASVRALSAPYNGNPLTYLCLSKYLRLDKTRSDDFMEAARVLLDAGADPNAGFWTTGDFPEFETPLYGAAGVAHHAGLTKLLLEYGADPNDEEAVYHSPETDDNEALKLLVETGKLKPANLTLILIRKHDWHDYEGVKYLLEKGVDPNSEWKRGWYPLHHALARSNGAPIIRLLLDHGADPLKVNDNLNAIARAAREGRGDVLNLYLQKGISIEMDGVDKLIVACALGDSDKAKLIASEYPSLLKELLWISGHLLARFSLSNNEAGVRLLLDLGVNVNEVYSGDGYFGIPPGSLAIHVAAWLGHASIVQLLIDRGSIIDLPDQNGKTPLALAVRACVDSYWTYRRNPFSIKALLKAGASVQNIAYPTGYQEADELLREAKGI